MDDGAVCMDGFHARNIFIRPQYMHWASRPSVALGLVLVVLALIGWTCLRTGSRHSENNGLPGDVGTRLADLPSWDRPKPQWPKYLAALPTVQPVITPTGTYARHHRPRCLASPQGQSCLRRHPPARQPRPPGPRPLVCPWNWSLLGPSSLRPPRALIWPLIPPASGAPTPAPPPHACPSPGPCIRKAWRRSRCNRISRSVADLLWPTGAFFRRPRRVYRRPAIDRSGTR